MFFLLENNLVFRVRNELKIGILCQNKKIKNVHFQRIRQQKKFIPCIIHISSFSWSTYYYYSDNREKSRQIFSFASYYK